MGLIPYFKYKVVKHFRSSNIVNIIYSIITDSLDLITV